MREELKSQFILPRDVIRIYEEIKEKIISNLQEKVVQIRTEDKEQLRQNIYDVVYISSNGDETITNYIADLYKELGAPGIMCRLAPDGVTKKTMINGYKYDLTINDRLYINNDDNTMSLENADIIIFGTKITKATYQKILKPLNIESKIRGRHLIVAAPAYDETALQQVIAVDLNNEYKANHDVNMVLTSYRAISSHTRKLINDFAVLMNTTVIDRALESAILDEVASGTPITSVFNIDCRDIPNLRCVAFNDEKGATYVKDVDELPEGFKTVNEMSPLIENYINLGFVKECHLGLKESQFTDLIYDKEKYEAILKDAKSDLEEKEKKYQKLGTFNVEVSQAQERLYALNLKMGIIEVGADSELSQKLIKDAVDDAIKAATSAFNHGVILGCNTSLIQVIKNIYNETTDEVTKTLLNILLEGFLDVYRTVLGNAFEDEYFEISEDYSVLKAANEVKDFISMKSPNVIPEDDLDVFNEVAEEVYKRYGKISVHNMIIYYSLKTSQVFDISTFTYSTSVINSSQTDCEILKATIDLISLLITGNQMIITQKHNF